MPATATKPTTDIERILAMIAANHQITYGEIATRLGVSEFKVIAILDAAVAR